MPAVLFVAAFSVRAAGGETPAPRADAATFADGPAPMAPLAVGSLLLDGDFSGLRMVVVGDRGHILLSDDAGERWRQAASPTRAMLTGVAFTKGPRGYAVGHLGTVLFTDDGGEAWKRVKLELEPDAVFLDVLAVTNEHIIAVGAYGLFVETTDAGGTWRRRSIHEEQLHFNRLARAADGTLYLAGETGLLLRSTDHGAKWEPLTVPYDGSLFGVLPLEGGAILVHGLRGHAYFSPDAGENWTAVTGLPPSLLMSAVRLRDGRVVVAGQSGNCAVSSDGGRTFRLWRPGPSMGLAEIMEASDGGLVLLGDGGAKRAAPPAETAPTP